MQPQNNSYLSATERSSEDATKTEQVLELEKRLSSLEQRGRESKFLFVLTFIILFDCIILKDFQNWASSLGIVLFELMFIIIFAGRCEVREVKPLIERVFDCFGNKHS